MRRREFIAALGGAAALPLAARAQERVRQVGALTGIANEAEVQERFTIFVQALGQLGWVVGRNVQD